jgi:RNA polymerase sigma-70 factor, ECF subfamily
MTAQRADELVPAEAFPSGSPEERALALAFKRGERDAYEAIHDRYEARVVSVCRRMLSDPDDAMEAAQEAFLRIYQGLPRFNGRYRLGAWIVRITTNVCLDQLRARSRRPSEPAPLELLDLESPMPEDSDPQILFLRHAEGRRVRKVLDTLPPLHRAALVLRDFEGIPYSDISETLEISEGQVKALLHRARKGFRRSWAETVASMLLPAGLAKRWFRPWDLPSHTEGAHAHIADSAISASQQVAATAAQAVNAGGGALHTATQFMADKAAPVVAAVVVGTASVGAGLIARDRGDRDAAPKKEVVAAVEAPEQAAKIPGVKEATDDETQAKVPLDPKNNVGEKKDGGQDKGKAAGAGANEPADPVEEPPAAPPADEAPADPAPPAPDPTPSPPAEQPPAPPPAPTWGLTAAATNLSSESLCACDATPKQTYWEVSGTPDTRIVFTQQATGALTDAEGDAAWKMTAEVTGDFEGSQTNLNIKIVLERDGIPYVYESSSTRSLLKYQVDGGNYGFDFKGRYDLTNTTGPTEGMPSSGEIDTVLFFTPDGTLYHTHFQLIEGGPVVSVK